MNQSYKQAPKNQIREILLPAAIGLLTTKRSTSAIIQSSEVADLVDHVIQQCNLDPGLAASTKTCFEEWKTFNDSANGKRVPSELKVLYLCGPEPLNDLNVLIKNGINTNNVWGVTSSGADVQSAAEELKKANYSMKLHHGPLADFFESYNETFDLIYYDACGHLLSKKPNSVLPLLRIFATQRLAPLSVMITNFCEPPEKAESRSTTEKAITAFYRFRYRDLPQVVHNAIIEPLELPQDDRDLRYFVGQNLEFMYSEFVTKFIRELACNWVPMSRAVSTKALMETIVDVKNAKKTITRAKYVGEEDGSFQEWFKTVGDMVLSPSSYPLYSFYNTLKKHGVVELVDPLQQVKINGRSVGELIEWASLLDSVFEGHLECLSDKMKLVLGSVLWYYDEYPFGCDTPLPNLFVNSMLSIYGRPWFMNARESIRFSYRAKTRRMFTDLFLFDQCRSYFDWLPTIDGWEQRFMSIEFQIVSRCIMDRIGWHNWNSDNHLFRGSAITSMGAMHKTPYDIPSREYVN